MTLHLIRVVLPYAVCGLDYDTSTGRVVRAAPLIKWMVGKTSNQVRNWVAGKGGTVEDLGEITARITERPLSPA